MDRKAGRPKTKHPLAIGRPITIGARSPKSILTHASPKERELYRMIYTMEPTLLLVEANKIMVQGLAISLTILDFINKDFAKNGVTDEKGQYKNNIKILISLQKNIARYCNDLGITSATKAKLGLDLNKFKGVNVLEDYKDD